MTCKTVELAMEGNVRALQLCMERLLPPCRDRPIHLNLRPIENMSQISSAVSTVVEAIGDGSITPNEGETLANILAVQTDVVAATDLDRRLGQVEHSLAALKNEKADPGTADIAQRLREGLTPQVVDRDKP